MFTTDRIEFVLTDLGKATWEKSAGKNGIIFDSSRNVWSCQIWMLGWVFGKGLEPIHGKELIKDNTFKVL